AAHGVLVDGHNPSWEVPAVLEEPDLLARGVTAGKHAKSRKKRGVLGGRFTGRNKPGARPASAGAGPWGKDHRPGPVGPAIVGRHALQDPETRQIQRRCPDSGQYNK